jgi:hypothetical protein
MPLKQVTINMSLLEEELNTLHRRVEVASWVERAATDGWARANDWRAIKKSCCISIGGSISSRLVNSSLPQQQ